MKRPILVAVIGYIIGIIIGLYFRFSIVLFYVIGILITAFIKAIILLIKVINYKKENFQKISFYQIIKHKKYNKKKKFSFYSISRHLRYLKLIINKKTIIILMIFSCLSNFIVREKNNNFNEFYKTNTDIELIAEVCSNAQDKEYRKIYKIKSSEINKYKKEIMLYLSIDKKENLNYGDIIKIKGQYVSPSEQRNFGGFNYREYLKTLNIYGTVKAEKIEIIEKSKTNSIIIAVNQLKEKIKQNAKKYLEDDVYSVYIGLVLGDTTYIEEDIQENFRNSSMSHILAVSGMHITYIVIGIVVIMSKISGKKFAKIFSIIVLILYVTITGFSPSIIRACSMAIIMLLGGIINRKADIWTSMAISIFIILIYNPFLITNIGFQYSYIGTIGILLLYKSIFKVLNTEKYKNKYNMSKIQIIKYKIKYKIKQNTIIKCIKKIRKKITINQDFKNVEDEKKESKIKQIISVAISVQIFILPITLIHFNTFSIYFLFTNMILSTIIGPVVILGFILLLLLIFELPIINIISSVLKLGIRFILILSNVGNLPLSKIYFRTPQIWEIILYFIVVIMANFIYINKTNKIKTAFNLRVLWTIALIKYNYRKYKKKVITIITLIIVVLSFSIIIIPKNLRIHFVDVGQGDCCFIETPSNKTILIDSGGSETGSFDVGKSTLIPYILDRGYTKLDYIFISHFDTDHVEGILKVMEELEVGKVFITKQKEESSNYKRFIEIVNNKKIKVNKVKKGDKVKLENNLFIRTLWPIEDKLMQENPLNNNSMVLKLEYCNISCLFTGDIEKIAEKEILKEYKNNLNILNSNILKVGHHGSKTSSTQEFLEEVKPNIALIGVGENNKFGHPNSEVLQRLKKIGANIYRTDEMGEITLEIDSRGNIKVLKHLV